MRILMAVCALACLPIAGCMMPHGVEMTNKTGKTLNVEYLHLLKDGSLAPYSTAILAPGGQLRHHPPIADGYVGERVRLLVPGSPEAQGHSILLHIPDNRTRDFDVEFTAGRLFIREYKKGRDWAQTGDPNFGE